MPPRWSQDQSSRAESVFQEYRDANNPNFIGPEGVQQLLNDIGITPEDIRALTLAWRMGATRMGFFSREEFLGGMRSLRCDSVDSLCRACQQLDKEIASPPRFRDFFRFAFHFCCTGALPPHEPNQKTLDVDTVIQMLNIVCKGRPHLDSFCQFLREQNNNPRLTLDQWEGFLRFSEEIHEDMSNYDDEDAWPTMMDDFVEWRQSRGKG